MGNEGGNLGSQAGNARNQGRNVRNGVGMQEIRVKMRETRGKTTGNVFAENCIFCRLVFTNEVVSHI